MKKITSIILASLAWLSVLCQYYLMIENRVAPIFETSVRFISFFTILTNSLVAIYFTLTVLKLDNRLRNKLDKPGTLTAVTIYITVVGLVYQILLRHIWEPKGLQMIIDEMLHTIIPFLVILFWIYFENKKSIAYNQIPKWLIYPFTYLVFILIRGHFSGFYPYPFVDVSKLGIKNVLMNSTGLVIVFIAISALFIKIGRSIKA